MIDTAEVKQAPEVEPEEYDDFNPPPKSAEAESASPGTARLQEATVSQPSKLPAVEPSLNETATNPAPNPAPNPATNPAPKPATKNVAAGNGTGAANSGSSSTTNPAPKNGTGTNGSKRPSAKPSSTAPSSESAKNDDDDCLGEPDGNGNKYLFTNGLVKCSSSKGKIKRVIVANFRVLSLTPIVRDDGAQQTKSLRLELGYEKQIETIELTPEEFRQMNWNFRLFNQRAFVAPKMKEYALVGIQLAAPQKPKETIYTSTGWIMVDGQPYFFHNDGAIGANEHRRDLKAELKENLRLYSLPDAPTGDPLKKAIRASLKFLDVGDPSVAVPLFASIWRAPLGNVDFMGWANGITGSMKTSHAVVAQQFYGKDFDKKNLPATWSSTGNFNQSRLHAAKDVLEVLDDFVLQGSSQDHKRRIAEADRLVRSAADGARRGRLDAKHSDDTQSRGPRGLAWSTAETNPLGESGQIRLIAPTYRKNGGIPISINLAKLSVCQAEAGSGLYSEAMAGYIQFLAKQYKGLFQKVQDRVRELRAEISNSANGQHLRTPDILANLAVGIEYFLNFAKGSGAIDEKEYQTIWKHCWNTLISLGEAQTQHVREEDPVRAALRFLKSADRAGRLIFRNPDVDSGTMGNLEGGPTVDLNQNRSDWFVGWRKDEGSDWLCDPEQLWKVIHNLFREQSREMPKTRTELFQEMENDGWITPRDEKDRPGMPTVRHQIQGRRQRVIEIPAKSFERLEEEGV